MRLKTAPTSKMSDVKMKVKYVVEDTDRHGNVRLYYRRSGQPKVRLRGPLGSPEFLADYGRAASGTPRPNKENVNKPGQMKKGSFKWLCAQYYCSPMFQQLDPSTQKTRRGILNAFCLNKNDGEKPYATMLPRHVRARRDAKIDTPAAANTLVKVLRQVYKFAVNYDLHDSNPAAQVDYLKTNVDGYHSWSLADIEQFEEKHPVGSTARLAFALALYTGQRRSDLVRFGRQHIRTMDGVVWLAFTQQKGRNRCPVRLEIPIIPELQKIIEATEAGDLTILVNGYGKPFTPAGFGNRFRKWCDEAGLQHCSVHGLRKAAAKRLAELGCTEFEIMAITGHQTSKEVTRYTRGASQRIRAQSAFRKMTSRQEEERSVPLFGVVAGGGTIPADNKLIKKEEKMEWQPVGGSKKPPKPQ